MSKGNNNLKVNERIRRMIDGFSSNHLFSNFEKGVMSSYTDCNDAQINPELYDELMLVLKEKMPKLDRYIYEGSEYRQPIRVLHTNSGTGSMLKHFDKHLYVTAFNTDYYCYTVNKALYGSRDNSVILFGDIADKFITEGANPSPKYDLVISQPHEDLQYHQVDFDKRYSRLNPFSYYIYRSTFLINKHGMCCVFVPVDRIDAIKNDIELANLTDGEVNIDSVVQVPNCDHAVIIIKKEV